MYLCEPSHGACWPEIFRKRDTVADTAVNEMCAYVRDVGWQEDTPSIGFFHREWEIPAKIAMSRGT